MANTQTHTASGRKKSYLLQGLFLLFFFLENEETDPKEAHVRMHETWNDFFRFSPAQWGGRFRSGGMKMILSPCARADEEEEFYSHSLQGEPTRRTGSSAVPTV